MTPLAGRVALVTGGSRGLGADIARILGRAGATVAVNYLGHHEEAKRIAVEVGGSAWQGDIRHEGDAHRLIEDVVGLHGSLDVLVSNAGVWRGGRIDSLSREDWDAVIDTTLGGAFNLAKAAVPLLREQRSGRIVVISSVIGVVGYPGDTAYAAAKAGVFGFVRALAKEVGSYGITVNAVAPGPVRTGLTAQLPEESWRRMSQRVLLPRECTAADVAKAVRYLASDGDFMTGQVLVIDGGFSL